MDPISGTISTLFFCLKADVISICIGNVMNASGMNF